MVVVPRFIRAAGALLMLSLAWPVLLAAQDTPGSAPHASYGIPCGTCHTAASWKSLKKDIRFDHALTGYALVGRHASATCGSCHAKIAFKDLTTACVQCHADRHAGEFGDRCQDCHQPTAWRNPSAEVARHQLTRFPLFGAHQQLPCESCHTQQLDQQFRATPADCFACHEGDYRSVVEPNHAAGGFSHACMECHDPARWTPVRFDHDNTNFRLTGAHRRIECARCHEGGRYAGLPLTCDGCHTGTYHATTRPNHAVVGFTMQCADCHSTQAWQPVERMPANIDHAKTGFPLIGRHEQVPCEQCHVGGTFTGTPNTCIACHMKEYAATTNPPHQAGSFDTNCLTCHAMTGWRPATFDHSRTQFPLVGAHAAQPCQSCHVNGNYANLPTDCWSCHQNDYAAVVQPSHVAGQFNRDCTVCHGMTAWKPATIDHNRTKFPLTGRHTAAQCQDCHVNGQYTGLPTDCFSCHTADYQNTLVPAHAAGQFPHDCTSCHTTAGWKPSTFDHATTQFPLVGAHAAQACQSCHVNGNYANLPTDCWSCHQNDYAAVVQPSHVAGQFNRDCTVCHGMTAWKPATIDHDRTQFPLTGRHTAVQCQDCHVNGQYTGLPTDCFSCHTADYQNTLVPAHAAGQFPHDCTTCHTTAGWKPSTFDHATTQFPLVGAHAAQSCQSCHVNGNYANLATDCWSCHQSDYTAVVQPSHVAGQFNRDCTVCHGMTAWKPATIDHNRTQFPLTGRHSAAQCQDCHVNGKYTGLPTDCYSCHTADYQNTLVPAHAAGQFPHDCTSCHTTAGWKPSTFDHATTQFPLVGAHAAQSCQSCHVNGNYANLPTDCWSCHQSDYTAVAQPSHVAGQFNRDCTVCHGMTAWKPATIDHNRTQFPLTGRHTTAQCQDCHVNGQYTGLPTDCFSCHTTDYQNTVVPAHAAGQFPHDCTSCHTTAGWKPSTFDHATTQFPLVGAHAAQSCQSCHVNGNYANLPTDCWSCHQSDYTAVVQPSHVAGQFNRDCTVCHGMTAWKPATIDHNRTQFPLTGRHTTAQCQDCHVNGKYTGLPTDCFSCHTTDYQNTLVPAHAAGQFPHDCTTCHTTTSWKPSTFDHARTQFPLAGAHAAQPCQRCHVNGNYANLPTDCFSCHTTDYQNTVVPAHAAGQFPHDCTTCHTTTSWKPSTFDHARTQFPLAGAHAAQPCQRCHVNGNYANLPTDCWSCHQNDYTAVLQPSHVAGQFNRDCTVCHGMTAWKPATIDHSRTQFPLTGRHATAQCQDCHVNGQYTGLPTDCFSCHTTDYQNTVVPAHAAGQFPHDCTTCHTTTSWKPSTFDHAKTQFPLLGAHAAQPCQSCHVNGNYANLPTDCWSCHQSDYAQALAPPHAANGFPQNCTTCHGVTAWKPSTFNHATTKFPIAGAHVPLACDRCHVGGNYTLTYTDCYQCHQSDFTGATLPANHVAMNLDHNCVVCHTQNAWSPATPFRTSHNVNAPVGFPIYGSAKHQYQDEWNTCNQCHTTNNTATFCCTSCHEHSNQTEVNNDHQGRAGYSYTCTSCANAGCHPDGRD